METVGVKELRDNLSRILKKVESGEIVRVLRHGKGIVEIRPVSTSPELELAHRLEARGFLRGGSGRIGPVKSVRNLKPDMPVSDFVIEDRR